MESGDEIEQCPNVEPHEIEEVVKSKAVVKFSQVQVPAKFNRLECNTNLNLPPSNWLTSADNTYGLYLHQALYHSPGFVSFRMAHMFPDCVGEVDVVADAENIKKLLKLPYTSKGVISMMVHKVGNTLLLDEFDVQKYLLRRADDDWKWLRTFIVEHILSYQGGIRNFCLKDKSREAIQTKNLLSKFLYHSLKQSSDCVEFCTEPAQEGEPPIIAPVLPEPKIDNNVPDPASSHHVFQRNVVWTFEDIRMLIGTDMPIFGGPNRPCISLRLRDMAKPINVLTGIDYWLDNLMCNVPEVVMCYHLDGIVQKYEIIKTEDLPYMEECQFSPQVIRNVAQNILSFLKANATKEGHTYWLFKARNDDVVKLYDLTTLCEDQSDGNDVEDEVQGNPFTIPVAMLLYTVARNMKRRCTYLTPQKAANIRALLDNSIKLLPKEKYPQIVTSSHYILSDLYIPAGIDPYNPNFELHSSDSDIQSVCDDVNGDGDGDCDVDVDADADADADADTDGMDEDNGEDYNTNDMESRSDSAEALGIKKNPNVAVKNICDTLKEFHWKSSPRGMAPTRPEPLVANTKERCIMALKHVSHGLSCLEYFDSNEEKFIKESEARAKDEERQRILDEEQNPNMAKPFKPIPLPYESLKDVKGVTTSTPIEETNKDKDKDKVKATSKKIEDKDLKTASGQPLLVTQLQNPQQVADNFNSQHFGSWNLHLKLLLLEKACLTYVTLAEYYFGLQRFGASLKAIYISCRCQQVILKYMSLMGSNESGLLGRAGDYLFQMSKNFHNIEEYLQQFNETYDFEENINRELDKELQVVSDVWQLVQPNNNPDHVLWGSLACYNQAASHVKQSQSTNNDDESNKEIFRRLGNALNELGVKYMHWAEECSKGLADAPQVKEMIVKSYDLLMRGIQTFTDIGDTVNLTLVYCNLARYMRFRAHLTPSDSDGPRSKLIFERSSDKGDQIRTKDFYITLNGHLKYYYGKAFSYYEKAYEMLGNRKVNADLWDMVNWEYSSACFTLIDQLTEASTLVENVCNDTDKNLLNLLQKGLQLCDLEHNGPRQVLYLYRAGLIYQKFGSYHLCQLRRNVSNTVTNPIAKNLVQLCKINYERASRIMHDLQRAFEYLDIHIQLICLHTFLAENTTHTSKKIKHLENAWEVCLNCQNIFEYAIVELTPANEKQFIDILSCLEKHLQMILKTLIKLLLSSKEPPKKSDMYKKMYMECLNFSKYNNPLTCNSDVFVRNLSSLLLKLSQYQKDV